MLDSFIDLHIREDEEVLASHVMSRTMERLHFGLVGFEVGSIGISFPQYRADRVCVGLGKLLRLHGESNKLELLMKTGWHRTLSDYIQPKEIARLPQNVSWLRVSRVQSETGVERHIRRAMKRKGWSENQAKAAYSAFRDDHRSEAFVTLRSGSTGQTFRLFIAQKEVPQAVGAFTAYGLSAGGTVPFF